MTASRTTEEEGGKDEEVEEDEGEGGTKGEKRRPGAAEVQQEATGKLPGTRYVR